MKLNEPVVLKNGTEKTNLHRRKHLSGGHLELFSQKVSQVQVGWQFRERKDAQLCTPCSWPVDKFRTATHRAHYRKHILRWGPAADQLS